MSRERKVQSYRRSKGLRIPPASKLATRRSTSATAKTSPYVKFYTALLNDPALAQDVAGSGFGGAKVSEKAKMAGQAWRSMSEGEKAVSLLALRRSRLPRADP